MENSNENEIVALSAVPSSTYALKGIVNHVEVLFAVKTGHLPKEGEIKRAPLNLAIVLDRSGSMSGKKLKHAKEAIIQVVEALSDEDILHLVVYDDNVEVVFENETISNKSSLLKQIQQIADRGSTNLWGGLDKGAELASKHKQTGFSSQVFLFSDGLVNVGEIKEKGEILKLVSSKLNSELQLKVSSFGLGNDFDEELMRGIAERGIGFIEGSEAIPKFVSSCLSFLLNTVANDALLKLRGQKGGTLMKIYGHPDLVKGAFLGDLRADNTRKVLAELEVRVDSNLHEEDVLNYELTYKTILDKNGGGGEEKVIRGTIKLKFTDDETLLEQNSDANVKLALAIQQSSEMDFLIIELLDSAKTKEAIALQEKQLTLLRSALQINKLAEEQKKKLESEIKTAEQSLEKLKSRTSQEARKYAHHQNYRKFRGSDDYDANYCD